jgi:hypothetical protein
MFSRLFLECQLFLMIFENRIQGEALKSGPKGREEIATSVRAWSRSVLPITKRPEGPTGSPRLPHLRRSQELVRSFGPRPDGRGYYLARLRRSRTGDSD